MARRSLGVLVVVVASSFVFFASSPAAQTPAPQRLQVQIVNVKPEALTDWLALQQKETVPALKKAGFTRQAWTTNIFGHGFEYFFTQPVTKFAEYDNPQSPIVRGMGEAAARIYNEKVRKMIEGQQTLVITVLPDSINPPPSYVPTFVVLNFNYLVPGQGAAYEAYLHNDVMPAIRKVKPTGYGITHTLHGGDPNEYVTARYMEKMAELDGPNLLQQAVGADVAAKMNAKTNGMFARQERRIYRFVPELSIAPAGTSTQRQ